MEDAIAWDLANSLNSPTNDVEVEPTLFETLESMFTQDSKVIDDRVIIAFEAEGAEILFIFDSSQNEIDIVGCWLSNDVINFGSFKPSVIQAMEQKDLDALFLV
ncbi:hypothetical protein N9878_02745, partial [bacterium]|nr:hypothetical protein [bacterium]